MACMEHICSCGYSWFDNLHAYMCPKCQGLDVTNFFDERPETDELDTTEDNDE